MSMLGPVTCSALTVIAPVFPLGELVCNSAQHHLRGRMSNTLSVLTQAH